VYWRRRIMVVAVVVAVVFLVRALFFGGGDKPDAASHVDAAPSVTPSGGASSRSAHPAATITPSPGSGGPAAPSGGDGQTGGAQTGGSTGRGTSSGGSVCPDSALRVEVSTDASTYRVGDQPVVRLTITNTSGSACQRDVGAAEQEVVITAGDRRIWSSDDCSPGGDPDVRTIQPGETLHYAVTWPGLTSQPGCTDRHEVAGAGSYTLVGRLGQLRSRPATLTLRS
jgi:hypothetical protein